VGKWYKWYKSNDMTGENDVIEPNKTENQMVQGLGGGKAEWCNSDFIPVSEREKMREDGPDAYPCQADWFAHAAQMDALLREREDLIRRLADALTTSKIWLSECAIEHLPIENEDEATELSRIVREIVQPLIAEARGIEAHHE